MWGCGGAKLLPLFCTTLGGEYFLGAGYSPVKDQYVYSASGNRRE